MVQVCLRSILVIGKGIKTEQVKCETQLIRKPSKPVDTTETEEEGFTMSKFAAGSQFETKAEKRAKEEKKLQN